MANNFLTFLRGQNNPALAPFHLDAPGAVLSPDLRELFRRYIDTWRVRIPGSIVVTTGAATRNLTAAEINNPFVPFMDLIVRLLKPSIMAGIAGLTDAHFTALRNAVLAVTPVNLGFPTNATPLGPPWPFNNNPYPDDEFDRLLKDFSSTVRALAAGNTFMAKLAHVRDTRFNADSFIDIRGCRAGNLPVGVAPPPPFLLSIQRFFGRAGALPTVTAPEWYQSFNANFRNQPLTNNADIDHLFNAGFNVGGIQLTTAEISNDFDTWSSLSNLDGQFTFFTNLFPAAPDLVEFASLRWRTWRAAGSTAGIPPLNLYSSRADDMAQLALGELLNRLRENFSAAGANLAPPLVTKLNALQPKVESFRSNEEQLAAFTGADFTSFYNTLSALATQIITITGMPAPGSPLVDAAAPSPLNRAHINGYHGNIRTYLTNSLNTDIGAIFSSIRTAVGAADAKRHYYFNIRLPLRVQTASGNFVQYVVFYIAGGAADATKSYMKCQWAGTPAQIADMHSFIDPLPVTDATGASFLETAILVETEASATPNAVAPLPDYHSHIKST
jgi:hypothetical protein